MKIAMGFVLAFSIGVLCRLGGIPAPAPPAVIGALLVAAMTTGYLLIDRYTGTRPKQRESLCGGPTGRSGEQQTSRIEP